MNKHEKRLNILTAAVFLVLLYTLAVIFLLKPAQSFSEEENRNLQEFPAWNAEEFFNGTYSTKINEYFADQFPFRNAFVGAKSLLETALLKQENNNVLLGSNGQLAVRGSTLTYFDEDGDKKSATVDFYFPEKLEEEAGYIRALRDSLEAAGRQFALVMPPRTVDVASSAFRYPADHSEALLADISRLFADCNYVDLAGDMKARYDAGNTSTTRPTTTGPRWARITPTARLWSSTDWSRTRSRASRASRSATRFTARPIPRAGSSSSRRTKWSSSTTIR